MNLGNTAPIVEAFDGLSDRERLDRITRARVVRGRAELEELVGIVDWADHNTIDTPEGAATLRAGFVDTGVPIAGPGAPLVSEFGLMELIATLERSPESGRSYVGKVIEVAWRLPAIWQRVTEGRCPAYKALQVADLTRGLSADAAGFVDRYLGDAVGSCTWAQVERCVAEAIIRHDPDEAERRRLKAADGRHFDITPTTDPASGLVHVDGLLDAADGNDLDQAVSRRAIALAKLGCSESLDVRRSIAAGQIARQDLSLDLDLDEANGLVTRVPGRRVELFVHLSEATITGALCPEGAVGRVDNTRTPISAEQIREWLAVPGTSVLVRPVIDLADHVPVGSYEIPDRLKRQVRLRDQHCMHPFCGRRAEDCDIDHTRPHAQGGVTCPCNLVAGCRSHHRAKTLSGWRYIIVDPGTCLWQAPTGAWFLVDHRGTHALDPPRRHGADPTAELAAAQPWETGDPKPSTGPPCPEAAG